MNEINLLIRTTIIFIFLVGFGFLAQAAFKPDRSVMSEAYWKIWNDDVQRRIDADIERNRKADCEVAVDAPVGTEVKVEQIDRRRKVPGTFGRVRRFYVGGGDRAARESTSSTEAAFDG